jgi:multidrug efflux pump subunit AcrB
VATNGMLLDADHKFRLLRLSAEEAILPASRRRLRPIVMTGTGFACRNSALLSLSAPVLAIAVIGGILISMVLSRIISARGSLLPE